MGSTAHGEWKQEAEFSWVDGAKKHPQAPCLVLPVPPPPLLLLLLPLPPLLLPPLLVVQLVVE